MYKTLQYYIINITLYLAVYLINDSKMNATPVFIIWGETVGELQN